ncbi:MAG: enoyl-CoA hydratase/isomerase family protein [Deltaproteobacteria bacterium]|nr:enoyl-CoA hydratase/isomerase family protein [Deltaproteobacteria bacterium]
MDYKEILFEQSEQIATITLNRPERLNAFTWTMGSEMRDALVRVENDPELRVSIITGAGRGFCAGADLGGGESTFDGSNRPDEKEEAKRLGTSSRLKFYFSLKKPVIVAYNGPAVGVGVTMTLPFDIRIASESARLGIVFNRRGVIPEVGCPWLLPRIVGISRAAELMYTGRILSAREALEFGLVSRVVPDEELMPTARELAREIAVNCAPVSVALTKYMLYQFLSETDIEKAERINHQYFAWTGQQVDAREGVISFLQKREPEWKLKVPGDLPDFFPLT